jgi:rhamnulokinase
MARREGDASQLIDPDDPLFYHPDDMKEAFDTFFRKTRQALPERLGGYLGCAYDSLCFSFRYYLGKLEELTGQTIEVLHVVGGGSRSELLNQRIATLCMREVVSGPVEGATLGNILVQAAGMGSIATLGEGRKLVKHSFPGSKYVPGPPAEENEQRYRRFLKLKHSKTL